MAEVVVVITSSIVGLIFILVEEKIALYHKYLPVPAQAEISYEAVTPSAVIAAMEQFPVWASKLASDGGVELEEELRISTAIVPELVPPAVPLVNWKVFHEPKLGPPSE